MNRESIDIEALLIRAYHEKQVDRFGHGDARQRRILSRLIAGGAPSCGTQGIISLGVDTSCYASNLAAREGVLWQQLRFTGDSLLGLHDAVLGLPTFFYEPLDGLAFQVWDAATALAMGHRIEVAAAGATIERVRRRGGQDAKRADELRPAGPKRRVVAIEVSTFLICHGRAADRPYVPDLVVTGRRPLYAGARKQAIAHAPTYETPPDEVVRARAVYATWHACLGLLQAGCAGLADLDVTGPRAPATPWESAPAAIEAGPAPRTRRTGRISGKNAGIATA